ncbi:MAG: site-specific integrase [Roseburia sp.]|nr:site-specific integrase [Roseburia sp.]
MTNLCTKVTVRKRPIKNGQLSLYLDFYPAIRNPRTGKLSRREYLGIYIYAHPKEKFEVQYNKSMLQNAELIRCQRIQSIINQDFGFIDHSKGRESFIEYFREAMNESTNYRNWENAFKHFCNYAKGECCFDDITVEFCQGFLTHMLKLKTPSGGTMKASTANNNFGKLIAVIRRAVAAGRLKDNIIPFLKSAKEEKTKKEFLTHEELKHLAATPYKHEVFKAASLFSCLTGLRISDIIALRWENICEAPDGGWCLRLTTQKTKTEATLPLSDEALRLCGERGTGQVFKGMAKSLCPVYLKDWIAAAGITKHITFHCFRYTFATLQIASGTDIYTVSKMLTHTNVTTTQVYADVVSELKREAANKITLE